MNTIKDFIILVLLLLSVALGFFLYQERVNNLEKKYSESDSLKSELIMSKEYLKTIRLTNDSLKSENNKLDSLNNNLLTKLKTNKKYEIKLLQTIDSFSDTALYNVFSNEVINY